MNRSRNPTRAIQTLFSLYMLIICSCSCKTEPEVLVFDPSKNYPEFPLSFNDVADISYIKLGGEEKGIFFPTIFNTGVFLDYNHCRIFTCFPSIGVMVFDIHGNFLRRLGRVGRGPGEYITSFFYVQPEEERVCVYDAAREEFLVFKYDGTFIPDEGIKTKLNVSSFFNFLILDDCLVVFNPISAITSESSGKTWNTSERTLELFPLYNHKNATINDIHYEKPIVRPLNWGNNGQKILINGHLIPSYSGLLVSTFRSDTTYVIEKGFKWRPFLVNTRHNGVDEGCLYPVAETQDYLFLCQKNNLSGGQLFYFAIEKKTRQAFKITANEDNPLPGPLRGKVQIYYRGLTMNHYYRFWEFQPQRLKEECYEYLPEELKALVDQCDEESNPILMIIKFKD